MWDDIEDKLYFVVIKNATDSVNRTITSCHVAQVDDHYVLVDANSNNLGRVGLRNNNTALALVPSGHLDTVILGAALNREVDSLTMPDDYYYINLPEIFRGIDSLPANQLIISVEDQGDMGYSINVNVASEASDNFWVVSNDSVISDNVTLKALPIATTGDQGFSVSEMESLIDVILSMYYTNAIINVTASEV